MNEKPKKQELEYKLAIEKYKEQLVLEKQQIARKRKEPRKMLSGALTIFISDFRN